MKIAVFHNYMDNIGGAEMVSLVLARAFDADLYTTNYDAEKIGKMGFEDVLPRMHSIGRIPKNAPFRQQAAFLMFRKLNLGKKYDFYIISGDWAMSAAVNHHPNLWYVHSPLNELWQFKDYIKRELLVWWKRPLFGLWVSMNRRLSLRYAKRVDRWVCNSKNTQGRIKKFYGRDAEVVYPPIDTARYLSAKHEGYWLSVNRLFKNKRVELQMKAFSLMPDERLIIVGSYERGSKSFEDYRALMDGMKPDNVEIKHWVDSVELINLYSKCKGFITTARDEDFGMSVIEALASGKPIIAPNEGGYRESLVDGKTGVVIDDIDTEKIRDAIQKVGAELDANPLAYEGACKDASRRFDQEVFVSRIREMLF